MAVYTVGLEKLGFLYRDIRGNVLVMALILFFIPETIGFQYIAWLSGGEHFTFILSALSWRDTFSDWCYGIEGSMNGWLFEPNTWLIENILDNLSWMIIHVSLSSFLLALLVPISRIVFIVAVALFRLEKVEKPILIAAGLMLLGVSVLECILMMTTNVIYGIPPGLYISIARPDVDTRLFVPIPILLVVGWHFSKAPYSKAAD